MGKLPRLLVVLVAVALWRPLEVAPAEIVNETADLTQPREESVYLSYLGIDEKTKRRTLVRPDLFLIQFGYAADWNARIVKIKIDNGQPIGLQGTALTKALKAYQQQNDLPVTGKVDAVTRRSMLRSRCGVNDVQRGRFAIFPNKWEKGVITYNFVKYSERVPKPVVELAIERAFGYWEKVTALKFLRKKDSEITDLRIGFYTGYHGDGVHKSFDGPNGIYGHASFTREGDIHFDDDEDFTENTRKGKNLRIIATHEIGHTLGLDHSFMRGSVMYPQYEGFIPHHNFKLSPDDIAGIRHMYGPGDTDDFSDLESMMMGDEYPEEEIDLIATTTFTTTTTTPMPPTTTSVVVKIPRWPKPTAVDGQPDPCTAKVDAAFQWHDAAKYFLRGTLLYRQEPGDESRMSADYPRDVRRFLTGAPEKTDAAVYSPYTSNLFLFTGREVYVYDTQGNLQKKVMMEQPEFPDHVDAAFINREGIIVLIKNDMLYEFDEWRYQIEEHLPISESYGGLPEGIDAVINDSPYIQEYQHIFFFKGSQYYKVSIYSRSVIRHYPREIGGPWFGCSRWNVPK